MASSVAYANPQQGGKKGKDKSKDLVGLIEERLAEINNTMSALTGRVDGMDRCIEGIESKMDMEELHGVMQAAMTCIVADFKKEFEALHVSKAAKDGEL